MNTTTNTPQLATIAPDTAAAAARYRARKAARIAAKRNRAQSPQHKAAIARRIAAADIALAQTGKVVAL